MINLADTDPIVPFIDSGDYEIKSAAVVNLLKYGGLDAIMAAGKELENLMHGDVHDKITAAQIIGELKNAQLFKLLVKLLKDESTKVQDAALIACRNVKHPVLLSFLLGMVNSGNYNSRLKAAIQANGEDAANEISSLLPKEQDRYKIIFLVQVLSGIKSNYSEKGLLAMLNYTDVEVNEKVLIALFNIQFNNKNYESQIKPYINEHLDKAEWIYSSLPYLMNDVLVKNALLNELNKVVKSLLYHFSFIYDRASVKKALAGFDSNNRVKRADALEILDTLLPGDLFNRFNWIAGSRTIDEKIHHFSNSYLNNSHEILTYILKKGEKEFHPWTITTAIHALEIESISEHIKEKYTHYHLESVRKIFRHKISKSKENNYTTITMVHNDQHLSQVERVLLLKSTSLFADTPDTVLAEIAGIVKEVRIGTDTRIFEKDDDGDCMYIIYEGEVSIHDGAHEYALLKNRDFFGELALLDSEPRSTAATAKKETLLLRIDQYDFLELISDRSEVAKGILTILSQRIRRQNELIKELKARLHDNL